MSVRRSRSTEGNLPADLTSFVGRRRELSEARRAIGRARLLTMTGTGGVGKTRLALRTAACVRRSFADRAWFVDLAPIEDAELLIPTVSATLGLADRSGHELDALLDFVADKRMLLVLDGCEHLVDACAALVGPLLRTAPGVTVLVTSRQLLGVSGESVLEVPPLSLPGTGRPVTIADVDASEAVHLFEERAAEAVPGLTYGDDDRQVMAQVCRHLDGLPLAIELAAVQLRSLSVGQLLERLDDRFTALARGCRMAPPRQRTLRETIDWSHDLCSEPERVLWARLSVFSGGFDLEAVEEICRGAGITRESVPDLVRGLIDKSIVRRIDRGGRARYRLLDTIREYGRALLAESGQETALREAHRDHYHRLLRCAEDAWYGPSQLDWLDRMRCEHANLRAALGYSLGEAGHPERALRMVTAMWDYWVFCGLLDEGRQWLDRALRQDPAPSAARVHALWVAGRLAMLQGKVDLARSLVRECQEVARRLGDDASASAHAAEIFGMGAFFEGDYPRAVELLEESVEGYRTSGDPPVHLMLALCELAWAACAAGDTGRALELGRRLQAMNEEYGADSYRFLAFWVLGYTHYRRGELERAAELIRESLRFQEAIHEIYSTAKGMEVLAWVMAGENRHEYAARVLGAADALWRRLGISVLALSPFRDFHEPCVARLRSALGEERFAAAFERGERMTFDEAIAHALTGLPRPRTPARTEGAPLLTPRERQVAGLIAQGRTNREIAGELLISQRTVEGHVKMILNRLGCTSRSQVAARIATSSI